MNKLGLSVSFKHLLLYALPTLLANTFMGVYNVVDGIFAANYIGTDALSCVTICTPVVMISLLIGIMLGTGGSALMSKKLGQQKDIEAREDLSLLVLFGTVVSIVICAVCYVFRNPLLRFLGADDALLPGCLEYTIPLLILIPLNIPGTIFEAVFVTAGKPTHGLVASLAGGAIHIILDWLFMVEMRMGLTGAAWATGISYCVPSVIGILWFAFNRKQMLYFEKPKWRTRTITLSCGNGSSEMVGLLATGIVTIVINNNLMAMKGSDGVAAVSVILYAQTVFSSVSRGYSMGIAPIVSYKFGQRKTEELRKSFTVGSLTNLALSLATVFVCFFGAEALVRMFADADASPAVFEMAVYGFRVFSLSLLFAGINIYASSLFTALNDGVTSAVLSFSRTFVFMILPLLILPRLFDMAGVWWSFSTAEILSFAVTLLYMMKLRNEKWMYRNEAA